MDLYSVRICIGDGDPLTDKNAASVRQNGEIQIRLNRVKLGYLYGSHLPRKVESSVNVGNILNMNRTSVV